MSCLVGALRKDFVSKGAGKCIAELPSKSIADYKQSVGFKWGLRRMGQVLYEYGYGSPWPISKLGIPT
ncbi:hypothetical protein GW17_00059177 [Ensete ventricosum]|nr:hypothetical protein GW17_00059177 [Ensete ventricosum]